MFSNIGDTDFKIMHLAFYSLIALLTASCSEDYQKNAIRPEFDVVRWNNPKSYTLQYSDPLGVHLRLNSKYMICNYLITLERANVRAICIVDLASKDSKWFIAPPWSLVRQLSAETLGVFRRHPSNGEDHNGYFLDINTLRRGKPVIPAGFPIVSEESQFIAVIVEHKQEREYKRRREDIWLFDLPSEKELILPASKHGLFVTKVELSKDRLLVSGETLEFNEPFDRIKTQLWKLPHLEKICEYEAIEEIPWRPWQYPMPLGKDSFCFGDAVGLLKVASLSTGKVRFSIGQSVPETVWREWFNRGMGTPILVLDDTGYVEDSGSMVCLETCGNEDHADIKTYDVRTGRELQAITIPYKNLEFIKVAKVAEEWIILCGWSDPKEKPAPDALSPGPRKMWIVPYQLKDLMKAKNSIEIMWGGSLEPEIVNSKLIVVMSDYAQILDLSGVIAF